MKKKQSLPEIEVRYKPNMKASERMVIKTSADANEVFLSIWGKNLELCEEFYIIFLNRASAVIGWYKLSQGGLSCTVVDARFIFSIALKCLATSIVLAHNHPSGNKKPSEGDCAITKRIKEAGVLFEISVLDHLIITADSYFSFADEDLL